GHEERCDVVAGNRADDAGNRPGPAAASARSAAASARPAAAPPPPAAASRGTTERQVHPRLGVDVVLARQQAPDAELSLIIGLRRACGRTPPVSLLVVMAKDTDQHSRHRIAGLVEHMPRDHASAWQPELDV